MSSAKRVIPMADGSSRILPDDVKPTILPDSYIQSDVSKNLRSFSLPLYRDLPNVPLYRDQVIAYINEKLAPLVLCIDQPVITPSMVNNYVKIGLIPAPQKKQYGREALARLIAICIFKQVLPISAVQSLFRIQRYSYDAEVAYNYVAAQLQLSLQSAFSLEQSPVEDTAHVVTRESLLVRSAVSSFVSKAYLMGYLNFNGYTTL